METSIWIWIVAAIIVVVVIIAVVATVDRKCRHILGEQQVQEDLEKAGRLRAHARSVDLDAHEKHASAARTAVDAEQAPVEAERLKVQAG